MKDEIKEILEEWKRFLSWCYENNDKTVEIHRDKLKLIIDYITNLQEKVEYNNLVLKALHRYFTEHECYETHEFLRQLESCNENDMVWLKRMAGEQK